MRLGLLAAFILTLSSFALKAAPLCENLFDTVRFESQAPGAQRFLRLSESGLARRFQGDPEVNSLVEAIFRTRFLTPNGDQISFQWKNLKGTLIKSGNPQTLRLTLPSVFLNKAKLPDGRSRPEGLNLEFAKLLLALMKSLKAEAESRPGLERVEIVGGNVVNRDLVTLLKEMGFRLEGEVQQIPPPRSRLDFDHFGFDPFRRGDLFYSRETWGITHPEHGRDWVLEFQVQR